MHILKISKGRGKFRTIYAPDPEEKKAYRALLPRLTEIALRHCPPDVVHGFMPGRCPLTNAMAHIGYQYTLSMDLTDFFDSVGWPQLHTLLPADLIEQVLYDGAARQGLPSSPMVSNIAAAPMDWEILDNLQQFHGRNPAYHVIYTRYADDLTFSSNADLSANLTATLIQGIAEKYRFKINEAKTKLQTAKAGRRIITGVAVDDQRAYPTRAAKRKLRAALHQGNPGSTHGLREWCKLRPPKQYYEGLQTEYRRLRERLRLLELGDPQLERQFGKNQRDIQIN